MLLGTALFKKVEESSREEALMYVRADEAFAANIDDNFFIPIDVRKHGVCSVSKPFPSLRNRVRRRDGPSSLKIRHHVIL